MTAAKPSLPRTVILPTFLAASPTLRASSRTLATGTRFCSAKYNPGKERPFPDVDCYFEDNFDQVSNILVIAAKAKGNSIESYGKPEAMLSDFGYLMGVQTYAGETRSEGGFAANKVSTGLSWTLSPKLTRARRTTCLKS